MNIHQLTSQKVGGAKIQAISLSPAICRVKSLDPWLEVLKAFLIYKLQIGTLFLKDWRAERRCNALNQSLQWIPLRCTPNICCLCCRLVKPCTKGCYLNLLCSSFLFSYRTWPILLVQDGWWIMSGYGSRFKAIISWLNFWPARRRSSANACHFYIKGIFPLVPLHISEIPPCMEVGGLYYWFLFLNLFSGLKFYWILKKFFCGVEF